MKNHEPWRNPPLQEAVFEIRFPTVSDYALFAGGMAMSQQQEFPTTQKLQAADIPEIVELAGLVKHRFISPDESLLFQTGTDVLSVNSVAYKGFINFLENIRKILTATEKFVSLSTLTRLGLRYINRFSNVDYPPSVLNINLPFQNTDISKTQLLQLREINKLDNEGNLLSINVQFPVEPKDLILDIDISLNSPQKSWDIEMILDWTDKAHDVIWDNFQILISENQKGVRI
ncbi:MULTISPECIES: TIGR04255 family protein [unclassified Nostoc]|uniref:TIGR04255 family protein n=1 Tax=unclassified Nostoc TaxID=2593658 RepID=UPI000D0C3FB5|nr:TIGR04255 family protein [Nostoc sp. 'Peltigera membranacea cyanobiont' N6]AVH66734.1 TIGR04255 family protein [Nostoc sp. 'Peltigera membranacea cyanobiont' N6]